MYAVGRLGSYITQGVYTVSGPFHPFGGAVDIVVVRQEDGSLKSSPWYVRFGKFQGVLKAKERVVDINVNGVDAGFSMYLDPRGEAYFLREVDLEDMVEGVSLHSSSFEDVNGKEECKLLLKSKSMDSDFDQCDSVSDVSDGAALSRTSSKGSRVLEHVLGSRSMKERTLSKEKDDSSVGRMEQLEKAEIAADLLESRGSTNHSSISRESGNDNGDVTSGRLETSVVLHEQHFVNNDSGVDHKVPSSVSIEESLVSDDVDGVNKGVEENRVSAERSSTQLDDGNEPEVGLITGQGSLKIVPESYAVGASSQEDAAIDVPCSSVAVPLCQNVDDDLTREVGETNEIRLPLEPNGELQVLEPFVEEQLIFGELDDSKQSISNIEEEVKQAGRKSTTVMYGPDLLRVGTYKEHFNGELDELQGNLRKCSSNLEIPKSREIPNAEIGRQAKSLPNICRFDDLILDNQDESQFYSPVGRFRSNWDLLREDASRFKKAIIEKSEDFKDGSIASVDAAGGSWSLWPFRSLASKNGPDDSKKVSDDEIDEETDTEKEWLSPQSDTTHTRELTPTPEQLASLNLAEGQNTVTFTFSTAVLGSQTVDARIYLWSWDARIVISDVDGTITKSDVLGQFMPLVGRDWSHIGVTHLFSAINENGYQMLYLSARSISQASITRQFLFNLKQDGKALPDGPVVISPDGLFPSLFREVIRRAPHEFKIACLEDIKACFPPDRNPFYAGFGNRDTDEFSYLKVGIPKGKIFIINPKGEVVINRCIDSKSYASLHALVNGIFPPVSVHEEEDYNSWNFWKLPPPTVD
ncbi:hypothetical protein M8C21_020987 [Ambrosia artemisiifolia]|uniref:LNS2/PITP domain-containing protein n=1 Tax=Ambrosia artemisiifolia TaxID=4212 RepID=A0AAD5GCS3_AMBAR|nr:hypothetical protein M8C21_020987 [Ambrosia artemisiifolia]